MPESDINVYEVVGGEPTFFRLVDEFYARVEADEFLRPLFPADLAEGKRAQYLFLMQFLAGRLNMVLSEDTRVCACVTHRFQLGVRLATIGSVTCWQRWTSLALRNRHAPSCRSIRARLAIHDQRRSRHARHYRNRRMTGTKRRQETTAKRQRTTPMKVERTLVARDQRTTAAKDQRTTLAKEQRAAEVRPFWWRVAAWYMRRPRLVRIIVAALFGVGSTLLVSPQVDSFYLTYFYSVDTRVLPSLFSTAVGVIVYAVGWRLTLSVEAVDKPSLRAIACICCSAYW